MEQRGKDKKESAKRAREVEISRIYSQKKGS